MEGFKEKLGEFCGVPARLYTPLLAGTEWTAESLSYRSRIEDLHGNIIDIGHLKFFNYLEKPGLYPDPNKYNDWTIELKLDGSLAIFTYFNNQLSIRTRGVFSYLTQENYRDFEQIHTLYPDFVEYVKRFPDYSFLCEIVTPNNKIVLNYEKVDFYLIGAINKKTLRYLNRSELDDIARTTKIRRPEAYSFNNIAELCAAVKEWRDKEGVVLSYNNFQNRIKIKGDFYLKCHRFLSALCSQNSLIDLFLSLGRPAYPEFYKYIETTFDFELAETSKNGLQEICDKAEIIQNKLNKIKLFVKDCPENRKEAAAQIVGNFDTTWRPIAFIFYDGRDIDEKIWRKLLTEI